MRTLGWVTFAVLSSGVALYAGLAYGLAPLGSMVHPGMRDAFVVDPAGIYTHVFAALLALLLGPTQFSACLRREHAGFHRWAGRAYLGNGVLVGGLSGLYISQFAFGEPVARTGFAMLAVCWLYTGLRAFLAIRRRGVSAHRRWMVRNYSLSFAAVTLNVYRLALPVAPLRRHPPATATWSHPTPGCGARPSPSAAMSPSPSTSSISPLRPCAWLHPVATGRRQSREVLCGSFRKNRNSDSDRFGSRS